MGPLLNIRVLIGVVAILAWGVFSYVALEPKDYLVAFVGGFANFVFFVAGLLAEAAQPTHSDYVVSSRFGDSRSSDSGVGMTMVRTALAVASFLILANLLQSAPVFSLDQIIQRHAAAFTVDGYRDMLTHLTGDVVLPLLLMLLGYFYHLGSRFRDVRLAPIFGGCAISMGLAMALYLALGTIQPLAVIDYFHMQAPPPLQPFGGVILKCAAWTLTLGVDLIAISAMSGLLRTAALAGSIWGRARG